jgi:hypothetical protein
MAELLVVGGNGAGGGATLAAAAPPSLCSLSLSSGGSRRICYERGGGEEDRGNGGTRCRPMGSADFSFFNFIIPFIEAGTKTISVNSTINRDVVSEVFTKNRVF